MVTKTHAYIIAAASGFLWAAAIVAQQDNALGQTLASATLAGLCWGALPGFIVTPISIRTFVLAGISGTLGAVVGIMYLLVLPAWAIPVTVGVGAIAGMIWQVRNPRTS